MKSRPKKVKIKKPQECKCSCGCKQSVARHRGALCADCERGDHP